MTKGNWDIIRAKFITSAVRAAQYPQPPLLEAAFIGRSNVGKSSLINSLCRQKGLAKVSATPGKTQTINFYELEAKRSDEGIDERRPFYLVDLPGYGYARTGKNNKDQWSAFIARYLTEGENICLVCHLVDIRHQPMDSDLECYNWLLECGLPVQLILTKADKLSKSAASAQKAMYKKLLGLYEDQLLTYSSTQHGTRSELIDRLMLSMEKRERA